MYFKRYFYYNIVISPLIQYYNKKYLIWKILGGARALHYCVEGDIFITILYFLSPLLQYYNKKYLIWKILGGARALHYCVEGDIFITIL